MSDDLGDGVDSAQDEVEDDHDHGPDNAGDDAGDDRDDEHVEGDDAGNRIAAALPHAVLTYLAKALVDEPDEVEIEVEEGRGRGVTLRLTVASDDMGKVIGKRGRVAQAIRTVVRAAAAKDGLDATVDIVD